MMRYTIYEIDRMRVAVDQIIGYEGVWNMDRLKRSAQVEDRVRTYLVGNIRVEEVEQHATNLKNKWDSETAWWHEKLAQERLRKEYGPRE